MMFASLKNKIKEETGNDPTRVTSSGFKGRTVVGLDSDFTDRPSPGLGLLSDGSEDCANELLDKDLSNLISGLSKVEGPNTFDSPAIRGLYTSNHEREITRYKHEDSECRPMDDLDEKFGYGKTFQVDIKESVTAKKGLGQMEKDLEVESTVLEREMGVDEKRNSVIGDNLIPQADIVESFRIQAARIKQVAVTEMKLRRMEEQLTEARHHINESNKKNSRLSQSLTGEKNANALLTQEVSCLRNELREQTSRVALLNLSLEKEVREKDVVLLRNAQLNQDIEMAKQSLRSQEHESFDLQSRLTALEHTLLSTEKELQSQKVENEEMSTRVKEMESVTSNQNAASILENELRKNVYTLEEQLAEKVKSIRVLQQHLSDLKKTLQREMKQNGDEAIAADGGATMQYTPAPGEPDVNFKYLKHVIMKFLTSREYEAQHLTRAVSTLLRFSPEEERLLRETLDWKMSWFGTRPQLGFGQSSKTIPPS